MKSALILALTVLSSLSYAQSNLSRDDAAEPFGPVYATQGVNPHAATGDEYPIYHHVDETQEQGQFAMPDFNNDDSRPWYQSFTRPSQPQQPQQPQQENLCNGSFTGNFASGDALTITVDQDEMRLSAQGNDYEVSGNCRQTDATHATIRFSLADNANYVFTAQITKSGNRITLAGKQFISGRLRDSYSLNMTGRMNNGGNGGGFFRRWRDNGDDDGGGRRGGLFGLFQ